MAESLAEMEMSLLAIKEEKALTDSQFHKLLKCLIAKNNQGQLLSRYCLVIVKVLYLKYLKYCNLLSDCQGTVIFGLPEDSLGVYFKR